ncbi:MAG TPA: hypothetical protein VM452_12165 [Caulifigura sp.]|nr:hypothetical protein [Caulifigura sp.]
MRLLIAVIIVAAWAAAVSAQDQPAPREKVNVFYELNSDGTGWKKLFEVRDFYPVNSPRVSSDGSRLAFDGWKSRNGEQLPDATILTCRLDGSELREVARGAMPSWSADGRMLCCSRYKADQGVWLMNADGGHPVLVDPAGWGIQWSPDGKSLAWTRGNQLLVRSVDGRGGEKELFPKGALPYSRIYWNMTWSTDSSKLAMIAEVDGGGRELAVVDVRGAEYGFQRRTVGHFNPMLSWNSDGKRLVFPQRVEGAIVLRELDPASQREPNSLSGIPRATRVASGCWMPDGSKLIVLVTEQ